MPRYFSIRLMTAERSDDIGLDLIDFQHSQALPAKSLADPASDVPPDGAHCYMSVEVRDETRKIILTVDLTYEARLLQCSS